MYTVTRQSMVSYLDNNQIRYDHQYAWLVVYSFLAASRSNILAQFSIAFTAR